jgi:RNA polymerase sigma-70 factor (ECF subfamily)
MTENARSHAHLPIRNERPNRLAKRKLERLRHIHPMTHEQKIALIEEARAARLREQEQRERE